MNYDAIMERIDSFFEKVDADVIIESLKSKGYVLDDLVTFETNKGSYVTWQLKDIGNKGEFISTKKRASTTCSFFYI